MAKKEVLTTLRKGNNYTATGLETMEFLIETLIPSDNPRQENESHLGTRRNNTAPQSQNIEPPITLLELELAIKNTKPRKAAGPDRVPPEVFINLDQGNREGLLTMFNLLLEKGIFPDVWKIAKLKVIRKAGIRDWSNPGSYRPISLLPIAGQIFERVLKQRLSSYLEKNNLLSEHQFGFRPKRSSVQVIELLKNTAVNSDRNYVVGILIDIKGVSTPFGGLRSSGISIKRGSLKPCSRF